MKVIESSFAEEVMRLFVPENILRLNPILAGGFIVDLYHLVIQGENAVSREAFSNFIFSKPQSELSLDELRKVFDNYKNKNLKPFDFGDIDIWFGLNNPICNKDHEFNFLISDITPDPPTKSIFNQLSFPKFEYFKTYHNASQRLVNQIDYLGLSSIYGVRTSTAWANTFHSKFTGGFGRPIQFIKRQFDDIDSLFREFDILNCCAAYYDGKFYFADGFEESFNSKILNKGDRFFKSKVQDKVWGANRAFKYAKRYGLEFSKEVCEDIVKTILESEDFLIKILKGGDDQVVGVSHIEMEDCYGGKIDVVNKETMLSLVRSLFSKFSSLVLMNNFNKEYMFLFLNFKDPGIMSEVKKYIELEERILRGESEAKEISWNERYDGFF